MKDVEIRKSLRRARKNWKDWKDVFEHSGSIGDNPLLADQQRFAHFLWEYSVNRTVRSGTHEDLRLRLAKSEAAFRDDTGQALDKLEQKIRQDFGKLPCTGYGRSTVLESRPQMGILLSIVGGGLITIATAIFVEWLPSQRGAS